MSLLLLLDDGPPFPRSLFASGEQGIWLDPSDFSTLYQDAAGTTPVTAVGQPVGLALDKRLGLAFGAELVTNGGFDTTDSWTANNATQSVVSGELELVSTGATDIRSTQAISCVVGRMYRITGTMRAAATNTTEKSCRIRIGKSVTAGTISYLKEVSANGVETPIDAVFLATSTTHYIHLNVASITSWSVAGEKAYFDNISVREIAGNHAYQTTATSRPKLQQDSNGLYYLSFDGTDDGMATPSIDFTGTDKMTVWAGVRKLSDAAAGIVCELSANANANNGAFFVTAPNSAAGNFGVTSRGTIAINAIAIGHAAPITKIVTGVFDIAGDVSQIRVNGTAGAQTGDQGTGNFGNYPLYIGRRGGTTLPFNGRLYQLIVRGAASNDGQIAAGEAWCNSKTRAY